jgi:hypothetical protein
MVRFQSLLTCSALVAGLAACGAVAASRDGGPEAVADAPTGQVADAEVPGIDAATDGTVQVQVYRPDGARAGASRVLVQAADGTFKTRSLTDSEGHAEVTVHVGDQITCIVDADGAGQSYYLITYVAVQPGDVLTVGKPQAVGSLVGSLQLATTLYSGPQGQTYKFDAGGSNFGGFPTISGTVATSQPFQLYNPPYQPGAPLDVAAYVTDSVGVPVAFRLGTVNTNFSYFSFANNWRNDFFNLDFKIDTTPINYGLSIEGFLDGPIPHSTFVPGASSGGPVDITLRTVADLGNTGFVYGYDLRLYANGATHRRVQGRRDVAPFDASHTFNDADLLPTIDSAGVDNATQPARPIITISPAIATQGSAFGQAGIFWTVGNFYNYWYVIVPPGTDRVQLPELSPEDAGLAPFAGAAVRLSRVVFGKSSILPSYDRARRVLDGYDLVYDLGDAALLLGGTSDEWTAGFTAFHTGD